MSFADELAKATQQATCGFLANGGNILAGQFVVKGLMTPGAQVPAAVAGLGLLALNYGCNFNPDGGQKAKTGSLVGCTEYADKRATGLYLIHDNGRYASPWGSLIVTVEEAHVTPDHIDIEVININGDRASYHGPNHSGPYGPAIRISRYWPEKACGDEGTSGGGFLPPPPVHVTTDSGCNLTVEHVAINVEADGSMRPVYKISSAGGPTAMATGGVIGGCNFDPIIYVGGGGGGDIYPPWYAPWAPGPDGPGGEPWWYQLLRGAAAGATEAVVGKLLDSIFGEKLPGTVYRLHSVCETGTNGGPVDMAREVVIPPAKVLSGIAARLDALPTLTQGLKDFKQPICTTHEPKQGIAHRVRFISDGVSPRNGKRYIKELGYRAQVERPLAEHRDHWRTFRWESGPFMVMSRGLPWGQPQVWAASFEEGRRVLTHAAAIAGVNLSDASHDWIENVTIGTRTGVIERFGVAQDRTGEVWVVRRTGSSGWPELAPEHRTHP